MTGYVLTFHSLCFMCVIFSSLKFDNPEVLVMLYMHMCVSVCGWEMMCNIQSHIRVFDLT